MFSARSTVDNVPHEEQNLLGIGDGSDEGGLALLKQVTHTLMV